MRYFLFAIAIALFLQSSTPIRVLFIGDSITDGAWGQPATWNATSQERNHSDYNHIFGHSYMFICASSLMADKPGEYECFNRGISGNTLLDIKNRWHEDVLTLQPDVISILVGTNDVEQYLNNTEKPFDFDGWETTLTQLIKETKEQIPNVKFLICTPFVAKVGWRGEAENYTLRKELIGRLTETIEKMSCYENINVVPFNNLFETLTEPSVSYWVWDGIHPTPAAHKKMADLWLDVFDRTY